jgi:hypothetical protein
MARAGATLKDPKEGQLQTAVLQWLRAYGILAWRMPLGPILHRRRKGGDVVTYWRKNHLAGFPDIQGVLKRKFPGRAFFIELKTRKGKLRPGQKQWLLDLHEAGAACAIVRSIDDLERVMVSWGEIPRKGSVPANDHR